MSRFYSIIKGSNGEATRITRAKSGIKGHIRGWNVGVEVVGKENENGQDEFFVYATGGSNDAGSRELIARITRDTDGELHVQHNLDGEVTP